jgi:mRNA-degrading endonuclease RelE of RelBE toxin-antitoxin system
MQSRLQEILIEFAPEFKRNLRALAKKYRHIRSDVQPVIDRLQNGEVFGDQVPKVHYAVFKVRIKNTDAHKGKRGGYRVIYYLKSSLRIILLTIYSKLEQSDVSLERLRAVIKEFENGNA